MGGLTLLAVSKRFFGCVREVLRMFQNGSLDVRAYVCGCVGEVLWMCCDCKRADMLSLLCFVMLRTIHLS